MSQVSGDEFCFVGPSLDLLFKIVEAALQGVSAARCPEMAKASPERRILV
jgi:hypothetical protein